MTRKAEDTPEAGRTPGLARKAGAWAAARWVALAAPVFLSACGGGSIYSEFSEEKFTFSPDVSLGTFPARPAAAQIVDTERFSPGWPSYSKQGRRLWRRRANEAGYVDIGTLAVPPDIRCSEPSCRDLRDRLARLAARHGADLLDIRGFNYDFRSTTRTKPGKCLEWVDRRRRQCRQYETKYAGTDREYFTRPGRLTLWRNAGKPEAVAAVEREWAATLSLSLTGHSEKVFSVAWSPDGRFLASGSGNNSDVTLRIWDAASGKTVRTSPKHSNWVHSLAWSPDGRFIAVGLLLSGKIDIRNTGAWTAAPRPSAAASPRASARTDDLTQRAEDAFNRGDDAEAVRLWRRAAESGDAKSQYDLGWMYAHGRGVAKDDRIAATWYRKSADQDHAPAQNNLGWMYEKGRGVEQSDVEAIRWYEKAASKGYERAKKALARLRASS